VGRSLGPIEARIVGPTGWPLRWIPRLPTGCPATWTRWTLTGNSTVT